MGFEETRLWEARGG